MIDFQTLDLERASAFLTKGSVVGYQDEFPSINDVSKSWYCDEVT